jgi:hypothetical protein
MRRGADGEGEGRSDGCASAKETGGVVLFLCGSGFWLELVFFRVREQNRSRLRERRNDVLRRKDAFQAALGPFSFSPVSGEQELKKCLHLKTVFTDFIKNYKKIISF